MAKTYEPIASVTLTTSTAAYTFSTIPSTYTDLVLIMQAKSTGTYASFKIQVNSDTGSNYSQTALYGTGSSAGSGRLTNNAFFDLCRASGISSDGFGYYCVNFMNYANTTTYKTFLERTSLQNATAGDGVETMAGIWRSTSAINSITATPGNGSLATGTTLTLYGIKAA